MLVDGIGSVSSKPARGPGRGCGDRRHSHAPLGQPLQVGVHPLLRKGIVPISLTMCSALCSWLRGKHIYYVLDLPLSATDGGLVGAGDGNVAAKSTLTAEQLAEAAAAPS